MDQQQAKRDLLAWMPGKPPEQWHAIAMSYNWGVGAEVPRWIIQQPQCERATASLLFWCINLQDFLAYKDRKEAVAKCYEIDVFDCASEIVERWNRDFYKAQTLYHYVDEEMVAGYREEEELYRSRGLPWTVREDLGQSVMGDITTTDPQWLRSNTPPELRRMIEGLGVGLSY